MKFGSFKGRPKKSFTDFIKTLKLQIWQHFEEGFGKSKW